MQVLYNFLSLIFRIIKYGARKSDLAKAKRLGMKVGENTKFVGDVAFGTEPYLIKVGSNCLITDGVKFITHNGGIQTIYIRMGFKFNDVYAKKISVGDIRVGNNVFIGSNSLILQDTEIGNNVIVAAGSLVKGTFPDDVVIAGIPAKIVMTLDQFEEKVVEKVISVDSIDSFERKRIIEEAFN